MSWVVAGRQICKSVGLPGPLVKKDTLEQLLGSSVLKDRLIGIQLLPRADQGDQYIHEKLTAVLNSGDNHEEVVAALTALRSNCGSDALYTQGNLKSIALRLKNGKIDERLAAARLLGRFGGELLAIDALLDAELEKLRHDEFQARVGALGHAQILADKVAEKLFEQLTYYLDEKRPRTPDNIERIESLLEAVRDLGESAPPALVECVKMLVDDYKTDVRIKRQAVLAYPAIAIPTERMVDTVTRWVTNPPLGLDDEIVQLPSIVAKQCRQTVTYVIACVSGLTKLKNALVAHHGKLLNRPVSDDSEYQATALRSGIEEVSQILVAFNEFIKSNSIEGEASSDAQGDLKLA